jgi:hypothetical protein
MSAAKLTALRPFYVDRELIAVGVTFTCSDDEIAAELISYRKAVAADDVTRRRLKIRVLTEWNDSSDAENFRNYWRAFNSIAELRAAGKM